MPREETTWTISATLIVKAATKEEAKKIVEDKLRDKLNNWFNEEPSNPPYPAGALLHYSFSTLDSEK